MNLHKCIVMSQVVDFQITYTWPDVKLSKIQRSEVAALSAARSGGFRFILRSLIGRRRWPRRGRIPRRRASGPAAHLVLKPQSPHHKKGLAHNMALHFGATLEAIGKNDRHLDYFHALTPKFVRHLDLETVAVGPDLIEIDRLQSPAAEALIPARRIGERHPGRDLHIFGGALAQ